MITMAKKYWIKRDKGYLYLLDNATKGKISLTGKNIYTPQLINDRYENIINKLPDESVDLIIIDPPYGTAFKGNRYKNIDHNTLFNDDPDLMFLSNIGKEFNRILKDDRHAYVFTRWDTYPAMASFFEPLSLLNLLVWDKDDGGHGMGDLKNYAPRHELIMMFSKGRRELNGKRHPNVIRQQDVRFTGERKVHPTQKPRALMEFLIEKSSNPGEIVADFFGGVYPVPRAAMSLFRRSIGVELSTKFHLEGTKMVREELTHDPKYGVNWKELNVNMINSEVI